MHTTTIFHGDCLQVEGVLLIVLRAYSRLLPLLAHDQCMRTASSVYRPTHLFEYAVSELAFKKKKSKSHIWSTSVKHVFYKATINPVL